VVRSPAIQAAGFEDPLRARSGKIGISSLSCTERERLRIKRNDQVSHAVRAGAQATGINPNTVPCSIERDQFRSGNEEILPRPELPGSIIDQYELRTRIGANVLSDVRNNVPIGTRRCVNKLPGQLDT